MALPEHVKHPLESSSAGQCSDEPRDRSSGLWSDDRRDGGRLSVRGV